MCLVNQITKQGAEEGVAFLKLMTDPQMMQPVATKYFDVLRIFSVKQVIADTINLFVFCSSSVGHVC